MEQQQQQKQHSKQHRQRQQCNKVSKSTLASTPRDFQIQFIDFFLNRNSKMTKRKFILIKFIPSKISENALLAIQKDQKVRLKNVRLFN